jgi:hypothetical protein
VTAGAVGGLVLVVAVLAGMVWFDNRQLERRVDDLRDQHQAALSSLDNSRRAEQVAQAALDAQVASLKALESEMAALRSQVEEAAQVSETERKALRAQVYAGRRLLGDGWVLVGGSGTNSAANGAVVSVDERVLQNLVDAAAKEMAARDTPREVTVNHNYANSPYWSTWWPVGWVGRPSHPSSTNRPPAGGIGPPPSTPLPPLDKDSGGVGIWRPTRKPFLPNPSPWPGTTPPRASPVRSPRVNPALPATQPVLLPSG